MNNHPSDFNLYITESLNILKIFIKMKRVLAPILDIKNLSVFSNESPLLQNISFSLKKYSILGIIGESGSGKSLTALSILNILKYKGLKQIGDIIYNEDNITSYDSNQFRDFLKKEIGIIFKIPLAI